MIFCLTLKVMTVILTLFFIFEFFWSIRPFWFPPQYMDSSVPKLCRNDPSPFRSKRAKRFLGSPSGLIHPPQDPWKPFAPLDTSPLKSWCKVRTIGWQVSGRFRWLLQSRSCQRDKWCFRQSELSSVWPDQRSFHWPMVSRCIHWICW